MAVERSLDAKNISKRFFIHRLYHVNYKEEASYFFVFESSVLTLSLVLNCAIGVKKIDKPNQRLIRSNVLVWWC